MGVLGKLRYEDDGEHKHRRSLLASAESWGIGVRGTLGN